MSFSKRLKETRERRGMTLLELSERIGRTEATVQRYESGNIKNLKNDTIELLAEALNVSPSYLMGWEEIHVTDLTRIPIIGQIACGDPITADENIVGYLEEPVSTLPSGNLFALQTVGNSMTPTIPEGSNVIIREQPDVEDGEIAAVLVNSDEEATLKRVKRQGDVVMLLADNPAYPPYIVTEDNPARILGKAVKVSFDL